MQPPGDPLAEGLQLERARRWREALVWYQGLLDDEGTAPALRPRLTARRLWCLLRRGETAACLQEARRALAAGDARRPTRESASILNTVGSAHFERGDFVRAELYFRRNLQAVLALGDIHARAAAHNNLALVLHRRGDPRQALRHLEASLSLKADLDDPAGRAAALLNQAAVFQALGETPRAWSSLQECVELRLRHGDPLGAATALAVLARVALLRGEPQEARRCQVRRCRLLRGDAGARTGALAEWALLEARLGSMPPALGLARAATRGPASRETLALAELARGTVAAQQGEARAALVRTRRALRSLAAGGPTEEWARGWLLLAALHRERGRTRAAARARGRARLAVPAGAASVLRLELLLEEARAALDGGSALPPPLEAQLSGAGEVRAPWLQWLAEHLLARHEALQGRPRSARGHLERARRGLHAVLQPLREAQRAAFRATSAARLLLQGELESARAGPLAAPSAEDWALILELTRALAQERRPQRLLRRILDAAIERTQAERGILLAERGGRWTVVLARNLDREDIAGEHLQYDERLARSAMERDQGLVASTPLAPAGQSRSLLCQPFRTRGGGGVLYLDHRFVAGRFQPRHQALIRALADQAGIVREQQRLLRAAQARSSSASPVLVPVRTQTRHPAVVTEASCAGLVGRHPLMRRLREHIARLADATVAVLIVGESGTGKEQTARGLHQASPRRAEPFLAIACGALADALVEAELCGYVKGAFTGADADRPGLFEQARGGTVFLDGIQDAAPGLQRLLLRILQEGEIRRLGDHLARPCQARVIASATAAGEGQHALRGDLYYRLAAARLDLPPLRERLEDIPLLWEHFAARHRDSFSSPPPRLAAAALDLLLGYLWPGNLRELENEVLRAYTLGLSLVAPPDLSPSLRGAAPAGATDGLRPLAAVRRHAEKAEILRALERTGGNKSAAARLLGLGRKSLERRLKKYGLGA